MSSETYINHPTFGLLFRLSKLDNDKELYTTLYAQRLFFLVSTTNKEIVFETVTRSEARMLLDNYLRSLRRSGLLSEYQEINAIYRRTF